MHFYQEKSDFFSQWKSKVFSTQGTLFENYSKCRIWILAFSTNFCPIKIDRSGNTVWPQTSGFQKLTKLTIFGISYELLSTQNVKVARFALAMLNETFSVIFKHRE